MAELGISSSTNRQTSDFLADLSTAVRQNPIPAALIGMGVLWLFAGGSRMTLGGGSGALAGALRTGAAAAAGAGYRGTAAAGSRIAETVGNAASAATHAASQAASGASNTFGEALDEASESASSSVRSARDSASGMAPTRDAAREWAASAQNTLTETFMQQPLLLGAIGLGIGAAIAAAAPVTDEENRLVGATSDRLKAQAREMASSLTDDAKKRAGRAIDEAQAQGLTPAGAGQALRQAADVAVDVIEKSISGKTVPLSPG